MNGAQSLIATLAAGGVDTCFANPGTTELPLVGALDAEPRVRSVLGLFEGVCTGAADGYARMTGRPALTLLHLGPGLANGLANLHNARRARSPVLNLVGEHATYHRAFDPPLASDIGAMARTTGWVGTTSSARSVAADGVAALQAARAGGPATLIVPTDCQSEPAHPPADGPAAVPAPEGLPAVADEAVIATAAAARGGGPGVLFLGGAAMGANGLRAAGRVAAATGWRLASESFPARWERGGGLPAPQKLPYFPEQALAALDGAGVLVLAGAPAPVAFFAYPDLPSSLVPRGTATQVLAAPDSDVVDALERLADALGAPPAAPVTDAPAPQSPTGPLNPRTVAAAIAASQPEGAVVVEEALTTGMAYPEASQGAPPHTYLSLTGGAIGWGPPCATGAALACPDRPVLDFQADGSALYTLQALWTQAREGLNVTTLICANASYRILQVELHRAGISPGPASSALTDLGGPAPDWVRLSEGFGVPARRAATAGELLEALAIALAEPGPHLIEMALP